jgi:D-aminoacyl-tRNA deacylase
VGGAAERARGAVHSAALGALTETVDAGATLLVTFTEDAASVSMTRALRSLAGPWAEVGPRCWWQGSSVYLVEVPGSPVHADHLDDRLTALVGTRPAEVLFLSRHVSAARRPALCLHPIGVPDPSANASAGGRPGQFPPPAPRLAAAYRILRAEAVAAGLEGYDVSFEATHHGPWLTTPAMFLEVGSCEDQWGDPAAAAVWAKTLTRLLGLGGVAAESRPWPALGPKERARATAVVAVGGGHYHPAMGDIAAATREHVYLGHLLASYSLGRVDGRWREVLSSAVDATRAAFPGVGRVVAFVAKNGLAAPHRDEVFRWLADHNQASFKGGRPPCTKPDHNVTAITNKKDI